MIFLEMLGMASGSFFGSYPINTLWHLPHWHTLSCLLLQEWLTHLSEVEKTVSFTTLKKCHTSQYFWLLDTVETKDIFCCRYCCGISHKRYYSSHQAKLVRSSFHLQQRRTTPITCVNLLCFQRSPLWGIWPNRSAFLSNTLTSDMCNYSHVSSLNCDLCLPEIKIRSSPLIRRKEKFNSETKGVNSALTKHGSHKSPFISEKHKYRAFRVLSGRLTSFSDLLSFYHHYINCYLSLRCQVFLSLLASSMKEIMNSYLLLVQF